MTLNGIMTLILRYFTELMYDVIFKPLLRFQNLLSIVYDHITQLLSDYLEKKQKNKLR